MRARPSAVQMRGSSGPGSRAARARRRSTAGAIARDEPLVLDADALNIVAVDETLRQAIAARRAPTLLTPHPGEAARLPGMRHRVRSRPIASDAAVTLATALRAQVVLKGNGSIVARPDGSFDINASGKPGARRPRAPAMSSPASWVRCSPRASTAATAMRIGVCLHGAAADALVAQGTGPMGVCASELIDAARALVNEATRPPPALTRRLRDRVAALQGCAPIRAAAASLPSSGAPRARDARPPRP